MSLVLVQEHADNADQAARALAQAQERCDAGDDAAARRYAKQSLLLQPEGNPAATVLLAWLERFGEGSTVDLAVKRVLAAPDHYAVICAPRFSFPSRTEYLKLSLLLREPAST